MAEQQLMKHAGNELLHNLRASNEELLEKLQRLGVVLSNQGQSESFHEALQPSIKALFADELVQHADLEVKISTAYCMSEILRITAPDEPCDDKSMEEFFRLAIMAFGKLANSEDCCYSMAASILRTFAEYKLCVIMLDLELDTLIVEMFQLFLDSICPNNAPYMEEIMTMIIEESEEISVDLLNILLTTAKKNPLNLSYILGERIFNNCNAKLQLTWQEAIERENLENKELAPRDDVGSSQNALPRLPYPKELLPSRGCLPSSDSPNMSAHDASFNTQTRRRVRKPNSLMKPEEGYDLTWINAERRSDKTPCQVKPSKKRTARPPKHSVSMGDFSSVSQSLNSIQDLSTRESCAGEENKLSGETSKKSKRKCSPSEKAARPLAEDLVGCRIKAWEPKDKMFYEGSITSYNKSENKHRINCDDGSVKDMNLSVERWEPIRDDADEQKTLAAVDEKLYPLINRYQYPRRKTGFRVYRSALTEESKYLVSKAGGEVAASRDKPGR
ncbi:uncharacterized protein LOC116010947 [Ipomoea triloba]|uniref:uncharacterized protein LOC116010947 n=1 Tax=Ipomoea triloba TaxID=35885 RepID=UPI00125CD758|nr:uncharacterized protein LOC116010947 [Ipomoea triloba]